MGVNVYVYADGDTSWYDTFVARVEKQSKGYNGVSLTNYDGTEACAIAEGSSWEQAGGVCYTTAETAISGSIATGICYIYSTASTSVASISWNQNEPAWRDDYCGYYWSAGSTVRALGGIYSQGTDYLSKWVYYNKETGPIDRYHSPALTGYVNVSVNVVPAGSKITWQTTGSVIVRCHLPDHCIVTAMRTCCDNRTAGTIDVKMRRNTEGDVTTEMAATQHIATGSQTDSTIVSPYIDQSDAKYYFYVDGTVTPTDLELNLIRVAYTVIKRIP